jgi:pyruvate formate-lyase activating enzyme-like uncharacterized protein
MSTQLPQSGSQTVAPHGCELCMMGKKVQIHLTFECNLHCAFCPIPSEKFGKDCMEFDGNVYASNGLDSLLAHVCMLTNARGAAISGGEPLMVFPRIIKSIEVLKNHFGSLFHLHLYTNGINITSDHLQALSVAGLDELRVNSLNHRIFERLADAPFDVVCEIPCVPRRGYYETMCRLIDCLPQWGVRMLNLNELEVTKENAPVFERWGLVVENNRVPESREFADAVRAYALRSSQVRVFFCSFENAERIRIARNRLQE